MSELYEVRGFRRQRVGKDGYINTEYWVSDRDGNSAPLMHLSQVTRMDSGTLSKLVSGKPMQSSHISSAISDYSRTTKEAERMAERARKAYEKFKKTGVLQTI